MNEMNNDSSENMSFLFGNRGQDPMIMQ